MKPKDMATAGKGDTDAKYLNFRLAFSERNILENRRRSCKIRLEICKQIKSSNRVFLKNIEEHRDGKIQELKNILLKYVFAPGRKPFLRFGKFWKRGRSLSFV